MLVMAFIIAIADLSHSSSPYKTHSLEMAYVLSCPGIRDPIFMTRMTRQYDKVFVACLMRRMSPPQLRQASAEGSARYAAMAVLRSV